MGWVCSYPNVLCPQVTCPWDSPGACLRARDSVPWDGFDHAHDVPFTQVTCAWDSPGAGLTKTMGKDGVPWEGFGNAPDVLCTQDI
jgi:hypothetical protein